MARGMRSSADTARTLINGTPTNTKWTEYSEAVRLYNEQRSSLMSFLTSLTTESAVERLQSYDQAYMEPSTEYGEPVSYRANPVTVPCGLPFRFYDIAIRSTWRFLIDATPEQLDADFANVLEADNRLLFQSALAAIFDNTGSTVNENGVPVRSLWNGDASSQPPAFRDTLFVAGHNHYLTTGSVTPDADDVEALVKTVTEHGHGLDSGNLLLFVNPAQQKFVAGLRTVNGAFADFIPSPGGGPYLSSQTIVGSAAPASLGSIPILGSLGTVLVSVSSLVPSGYMLAVASEGADSARNVLAMREHPTASLRGLRPIPGGDSGYPLQDHFYMRGMGMGVVNRGAAAIMQITTGSYTVPAAYRRGAYLP